MRDPVGSAARPKPLTSGRGCVRRILRGLRKKGTVVFPNVHMDRQQKRRADLRPDLHADQEPDHQRAARSGRDAAVDPQPREGSADQRITTKRAYEELEKEGFIYTVAAKGCFVAPKNTELLREEHLKQMESHLQEAIALAAACGLGEADVAAVLHTLYEES